MMLLYLHGLNSAGTAGKAIQLKEAFASLPVYTPTYTAHRPSLAVEQLSQNMNEIADTEALIIVGSSIGGCYGQYLARHYPIKRLMMINPSLQPWTLMERADRIQTNFVTGESYELTREDVEQTRRFRVDDVDDGVPTTLFLDKGDEVIDYRNAAEQYRDVGELFIFEGGDHRFQHMTEAIEIIRNWLD